MLGGQAEDPLYCGLQLASYMERHGSWIVQVITLLLLAKHRESMYFNLFMQHGYRDCVSLFLMA